MGVTEFVSRLTRGQAGILGAVGGYALGIVGGPVIKLFVYLLMFVALFFVEKSLKDKFEQQWGLMGVVLVVIALNSVSGVQRWLSNTLGGTFQQIPTLALAVFGAYIAVRVHEVGLLDEDEDSNFS